MIDREKVIDGLEHCTKGPVGCQTECPYKRDFGCRSQLSADALTLLKAQEPVKPKVDVDEWKCGKCGHKLEHQELLGDNVLLHEQYNYCPECGRKVKWE